MIRVGLIGYGYWGPNVARNLAESADTQLAAVADLNEDRLGAARRRHVGVDLTTDANTVIHDPRIDAVAITTPVSTHFSLAMAALAAGKHVLIEKPMTASSQEALRLIDEASSRGLTLMVDHTFVYTGAVRKIRELVQRGSLGDIYYYDSTRVNLGLIQQDVDVIWDLAVHDVAIMDYILPGHPVDVSATGVGYVDGASENLAYVTAFYDSPLIAHLNVNWLSPVKIRRTLIGGSRQMIVYDDIETSEKVKVYDKGVDVRNGGMKDTESGMVQKGCNGPEARYRLLVSYRSGDMYAPKLDGTEALRGVVQHFGDCIRNKATPLTDGHAGLRVVRVLEAATRSMKGHGRLEPVLDDSFVAATA